MQKAIDISKKIVKDIEKNWLPDLEDINLHKEFEIIYRSGYSLKTANTSVCFIINSYDPDSGWIDLKKDRYDDKEKILHGLNANPANDVYKSLLDGDNDTINDAISNYLDVLPNWKFRMVLTCFDFFSKHMRLVRGKTNSQIKAGIDKESGDEMFEDMDVDKVLKAHENKGKLLAEAYRQRELGEKLLLEIKSEFVKTNWATQSDFGFEITDLEKYDPMSWRQYIKRNKEIIAE